jgi:hypothetical protein
MEEVHRPEEKCREQDEAGQRNVVVVCCKGEQDQQKSNQYGKHCQDFESTPGLGHGPSRISWPPGSGVIVLRVPALIHTGYDLIMIGLM